MDIKNAQNAMTNSTKEARCMPCFFYIQLSGYEKRQTNY